MLKRIIEKLKKYIKEIIIDLLSHPNDKYKKSLTASERNLEALLKDERFYDSFFKDYLIEGINFQLKILAHEDYKDFIENESHKVVGSIIDTICDKFPPEIKKILKYKNAKICVRDIKTLRKLRADLSAIGVYEPDFYNIEVGLAEMDESINTLYHELGHFIDNAIKDEYIFKISGKPYYSQMHKETTQAFKEEAYLFRSYAQTNITEYVAVAFEEYFKDSKLIHRAPLTKKLLDSYMERLRVLYKDCIDDVNDNIA